MVDYFNNGNTDLTSPSSFTSIPNARDNNLYQEVIQIFENNSLSAVNELWLKKHQNYCLMEWFLVQSVKLSNPSNTIPLEQAINYFLTFRDKQIKLVSLLLSHHYDNKNLIQWILVKAQSKIEHNPLVLIEIIERILKSTSANACCELLNIKQNSINLIHWYLNNYANGYMNNTGNESLLAVIQIMLKSKVSAVIAELLRVKRDNKNLIQWSLYQYHEMKSLEGEEFLREAMLTIAKSRRKSANEQLLGKIPGKNYCWIDWLINFTKRKEGKDACIPLDIFFQTGLNILSYLYDIIVELPIELVSENVTNSENIIPEQNIENISYLALMIIKSPANLITVFPRLSHYLKRNLLFQLIQLCQHPKLKTILYDYIKKIINNTSSQRDRNLFLTLLEDCTKSVSCTSELNDFLSGLFSEETDPFVEADLDQLFNGVDDLLSLPLEVVRNDINYDYTNNHVNGNDAVNSNLSLPPSNETNTANVPSFSSDLSSYMDLDFPISTGSAFFRTTKPLPTTSPTKSFNIISFSMEGNILREKSVNINKPNISNSHSQLRISSRQKVNNSSQLNQTSIIAPISLFKNPLTQNDTIPVNNIEAEVNPSSLTATNRPSVGAFLSSTTADPLVQAEINSSRNIYPERVLQTTVIAQQNTLEKSPMIQPLNFELDWKKVKSVSDKRKKIDTLLKDDNYLYRLINHVEMLLSTNQLDIFIKIITDILSSRNAAAIAVFEARLFEGKKIFLHYIENAHNHNKNDKLIYNYAVRNILNSYSKAAVEFLLTTTIVHSEERKNLIEIHLSTSLQRGESYFLEALNRCINTGTPLTTYLHNTIRKPVFLTNDSILLTPPDIPYAAHNASSVIIYLLKNPDKLITVLRGKSKPLKIDILTQLQEACGPLQFCSTFLPSLDELRINILEQINLINKTKISQELTGFKPNEGFINQIGVLTGTKRNNPDTAPVKYKTRKKITTVQMLDKIGFLSSQKETTFVNKERKEMDSFGVTGSPSL